MYFDTFNCGCQTITVDGDDGLRRVTDMRPCAEHKASLLEAYPYSKSLDDRPPNTGENV